MLGNLGHMLLDVKSGVTGLIAILCLLVGAGIGILVYYLKLKKDKKDAKNQSKSLIEQAQIEAEQLRKEALLEIKDERHKLRAELEEETRQSKNELQKIENRLDQKEDMLSRKQQSLDQRIENNEQEKTRIMRREDNLEKREINISKKEEDLVKQEESLFEKESEIAHSHTKMIEELERVSNLTAEEAKAILVQEIEEDAKKDAVIRLKAINQNIAEEAENKARELISSVIQRCAVDYVADSTTSIIELPSDDMKGKLIGRSGRNIRAIENCTGVDVLIDDTPDIITVSCFEPVRREIACLSIKKLMQDGRIHPSKIEETVDKMRAEVEVQMKKAGEDLAFETGVYGMHPEMIKILGRMKYRYSYGQNMIKHSAEVSYVAGMLANELGADVKVCRRAGLLHDIGKALDHEIDGTHVQIGVDLCKKYKESKAVIHAIEAHHFDVEPTTLEAVIVQVADAISGARPGARRESIENYIKRLTKLEEIASSFAGVEKSYAIQAGREIRVAVKADEVDDTNIVYLARDIAKKLEDELEYPGQIKVNVIRELRHIEYAK